MALSPEMIEFCESWMRKADSYTGSNLSDYYNKAFTLFTLYNRLYAEATFTLAREGTITLAGDKPFPDSKGAKEYAPQFIGHDDLLTHLLKNSDTKLAIEELIRLISNETFHIKLSMPFGYAQRDKDLVLLENLRSQDIATKVSAIMDAIYSVRCNMFHGNKAFSEVQIELLEAITTILRSIVELLFRRLRQHEERNI